MLTDNHSEAQPQCLDGETEGVTEVTAVPASGVPSTLTVSYHLPEPPLCTCQNLGAPTGQRGSNWPTTKKPIYLRSFLKPLTASLGTLASSELKTNKNKGCVLSQAQNKFSISSFLSRFSLGPNLRSSLRAETLASAAALGHSLHWTHLLFAGQPGAEQPESLASGFVRDGLWAPYLRV